jgi:hypothetical protein
MTERQPTAHPRRSRLRAVAIVAGVVTVSLAGIGTASASTRHRHHRPAAVQAQSPGPNGSPATSPSSASPAPAADPTTPTTTATTPKTIGGIALPPANAGFDYQIGGPYPPPAGIHIVSRDHSESPAAGLYNLCYINAYQTQPDEADTWMSKHDDLLLKKGGSYVIDGEWNEMILDISTAAKRGALASIIGVWIDGCAAKGFQAIEPDNLDAFTRSQGLLSQANAVEFGKLLAARAHAKGLAIAQKNTAQLGSIGKTQAGFDFAVAEECQENNECQDYTQVYGDYVLIIEYSDSTFQSACNQWGAKYSIVRRDKAVSVRGVFKSC